MPKIENYDNVADYYQAVDEFWSAALDSLDTEMAA
jgi:hypothetical protein